MAVYGRQSSAFEPTDVSRGERVATVTLGVVLYLESDLRAIWPAVVSAWQFLIQRPWATDFRVVRRWDEAVWRTWDSRSLPWLSSDLAQYGPLWPYWKVELADAPRFGVTGVEWQDVPRAQTRYPRASYFRLRLPLDTPTQELLAITRGLLELLPVQQGRAGYLCHVDESSRGLGFDQAWAWARRYYGVDIVDPVEGTWDAPRGLLGVSWLTVLGARWVEGELKDVPLDTPASPVQSFRAKHGLILAAGCEPPTGDQNRFEDVSALTAVSRLVEPALIAEPTQLPGMFTDHESTKAWIRRFLDPTTWRDSA
jgi:hypothetical protein